MAKRKKTTRKKKKTGCKIIRLGKGKGVRYGCYNAKGLFRFVKPATYRRRTGR
jgi:hypothetical protein